MMHKIINNFHINYELYYFSKSLFEGRAFYFHENQ